VDLRYTFTTTAAPVQAEGTVAGRPFYFRSRHEEWTFSVAEQPGVDPADLETPGADDRGWVRAGRFDGRSIGSHLSAAEADALIRECARAYLAERAS
jgi:hypothetical protein